jgi:hypothetical protein
MRNQINKNMIDVSDIVAAKQWMQEHEGWQTDSAFMAGVNWIKSTEEYKQIVEDCMKWRKYERAMTLMKGEIKQEDYIINSYDNEPGQ